jgi:hypothetical protein
MLHKIRTSTRAMAAVLGVFLVGSAAQAGWGIGVRIGIPICAPPCYYYRPYPVYYVPPPVVVQPAPVLVPAPAAQPAYQTPVVQPANQAQTVAAQSPVVAVSQSDVNRHLQLLANADERVRADSVMQLGRLKVTQAVDPLAATLAGDRSPVVREAAARALGLIGSPKALTALQNAALADGDRDVRHSAQFAMDVIQAGR